MLSRADGLGVKWSKKRTYNNTHRQVQKQTFSHAKQYCFEAVLERETGSAGGRREASRGERRRRGQDSDQVVYIVLYLDQSVCQSSALLQWRRRGGRGGWPREEGDREDGMDGYK